MNVLILGTICYVLCLGIFVWAFLNNDTTAAAVILSAFMIIQQMEHKL